MLTYAYENGYGDEYTDSEERDTNTCCVCEREIYDGEACYCFEGNTVCESCCSAYVIDHYWFSSPKDIKL